MKPSGANPSLEGKISTVLPQRLILAIIIIGITARYPGADQPMF